MKFKEILWDVSIATIPPDLASTFEKILFSILIITVVI
jgi:hypothetical protein